MAHKKRKKSRISCFEMVDVVFLGLRLPCNWDVHQGCLGINKL
jgi:hypothetical protein